MALSIAEVGLWQGRREFPFWKWKIHPPRFVKNVTGSPGIVHFKGKKVPV